MRRVLADLCFALFGGLLLVVGPHVADPGVHDAGAGQRQPSAVNATGTTVDPPGTDAATLDKAARRPGSLDITLVTGDDRRTVRTSARTVSDLLRDQDITVGPADLVTPIPSARLRDGLVVAVGRVSTAQDTTTTTLPHGTLEVFADQLPAGRRRLQAAGVDGELARLFAVTTVDGVEVSRRLTSERVTRVPVDEVIQIGTLAADRTAAASSASSGSGSGWSGAYPQLGDTVWDRLAQCESGHNWSINTGNGYYGGLQFNLPTWRAYGGVGYPHQHSRAEQIAVAERLRAARGFAPWPACARKLGLI